MKVAIIGSGLSGLTAAAYLAQKEHDITVFEQFNRVGGVTAPIEKEGYKWDLGQLIIEGLGPSEPLGVILSDLGIQGVDIEVEDRGYVFPEFEINKPELYQGFKWRIDHLKRLFPEDTDGLEDYWEDYLNFTQLMTFVRRMEQSKGIKSFYWKLRLLIKMITSGFLSKKDWSATELMNHYFVNETLQLVFISIIADFFTPPSKFLGLGVFSLNPEAIYDKRMPKLIEKNTEQLYHYNILGGISTMVDAFAEQIKNLGGTIKTDIAITKIIIEDNKAKGLVDAEGNKYNFDAIIASGSAKKTFLELVGKKYLPLEFIEDINSLKLMESVFMVHLGLKKGYNPSKPNHGYTVRYYYGIDSTKDLEDGINDERKGNYHEGEKGFVVHIPTFHSPEMAPEGHHAMTIYTICPNKLKEDSWEQRKEEFADKLLEYAENYFPNLRKHIDLRVIITPQDFRERTFVDHHAFGGIAPYMDSPKIPFKTPIENLWFIGAQSESGGGVNNVIPGAYKVGVKLDDLFG
ncbi:MAG: putative Dehydrosqualene desaturase [Promethearchaeota archaeon]|nr:MAG: putative Dehydrosqualene desaturase [Candidatus Lokiarchaeota archaeon]